MATLETISEQRLHSGFGGFYRHRSPACGGLMRLAVYPPTEAARQACPVRYFLTGLTCTEEPATIKTGAQRLAAELGLILVVPDTSPRATGFDGATGDWGFGAGAGFQLDATRAPWSPRFNMPTHVVDDLRALIAEKFPLDTSRSALCGHSMGGHGSLTIALKHPARYRAMSAFAPIVAPGQLPRGRKALPRYVGEDPDAGADDDACEVVRRQPFPGTILTDQRESDPFLEAQLKPELFDHACAEAGQALRLRRRAGDDHSYWFLSGFIDDHLRHHVEALGLQ